MGWESGVGAGVVEVGGVDLGGWVVSKSCQLFVFVSFRCEDDSFRLCMGYELINQIEPEVYYS